MLANVTLRSAGTGGVDTLTNPADRQQLVQFLLSIDANTVPFPKRTVTAFSTTPDITPDTPLPLTIFDQPGDADSHGLLLTKHERFLWVADRASNLVDVVGTNTDSLVNQIPLAGPVSDDPAPDLLALSPSGNRIYTTLRGPNPLTGNNPTLNNAKGSTPGLGVIRVEQARMNGTLQDLPDLQRGCGHGTCRSPRIGCTPASPVAARSSYHGDR